MVWRATQGGGSRVDQLDDIYAVNGIAPCVIVQARLAAFALAPLGAFLSPDMVCLYLTASVSCRGGM